MIIGDRRTEVIANIKTAAEKGDFYAKVEVNDPLLTHEQSEAIVNKYAAQHSKLSFRFKSFTARRLANLLTVMLNRDTEILGIEKLEEINSGAIITSNHFSPVENTVIRMLVRKMGKNRINIVSQETNLAMTGIIGFLMNYADIIPIADCKQYMQRMFPHILQTLLNNKEFILIYPEQEMWFNYRKPRPPKRGAYYYAAKFGVPIISCFVTMTDMKNNDTEAFKKVKFTLHILDVIYPDRNKTVKENSIYMCELDYSLKKSCYERFYGRPLDYRFSSEDIGGWICGNE